MAPYGVKMCLNGNEYAKRQLQQRGIAFGPLDNSFLSCDDPDLLHDDPNVCINPKATSTTCSEWLAWNYYIQAS